MNEEVEYFCWQCDLYFSQKGKLVEHKGGVRRSQIPLLAMQPAIFSERNSCWTQHEGVKYSCGLCGQQYQNGNLTKHKRAVYTLVRNADNNFLGMQILLNKKEYFMKELNIIVGNAANNFLWRGVSLNMQRRFMKESNIIVGNVANNFLRSVVLLNMERHFMRESNILVGNAANNFLRGEVLLKTKRHFRS